MSPRTRALAFITVAAVTLINISAVSSNAAPVAEDAGPQGVRWTEVTPGGSPSSRPWAAAAYNATSDQLVMFGGNDGGGGSDQTWVFDGEAWTLLDLEVFPDSRLQAAMTYDRAHQEVVLFGGSCDCPPFVYGDTWVFDGEQWTERRPPTSPPATYGARMAYDPRAREVVMFGGKGGDGPSNETWVWDGTTWSIRYPADSPGGRSSAGMAYSPRLGGVVLFGGQGDPATQYFGDTWLWKNGNWTELPDASGGPARAGVAMATLGRRVVMFGGYSSGGSETWVLGRDTWHRKAQDHGPSSRHGSAMAFDSTRHRVVMFSGGSQFGEDPQDTWVLQRR